jgi:hypothetical protein
MSVVPLLAGVAVFLLLMLLLRGFAFADVKRLARGLRVSGATALGIGAGALALTGRFGYAVIAAGLAWALLMGGPPPWRQPGPGRGPGTGAPRSPPRGAMSRAEALKVLGLEEGVSDMEIRAAHRRLIMQTHPDKGGSSYLAAKINEAKDVLLDE